MFSWAFKTLKIIISRWLSQTTTHLRSVFVANAALGLFYYKEHTKHPKLCNKFPTSESEKEPDLGAASDSYK